MPSSLRPYAYIAGLLLLAGVGAAVYLAGRSDGAASVQADWDKEKAEQADAMAKAVDEARNTERALAKTAQDAVDKQLEDSKREGERKDKLISDLYTGQRRMLDRFTCPRVSDVPGGAGSGDEGTEGGLSNDDGAFLIREARRADAVVEQLQACQAIVAGYEEAQNGRE